MGSLNPEEGFGDADEFASDPQVQAFLEQGADESDIIEGIMEQDYEVGEGLKNDLIPFAVRWYTGEARPDDLDDDDDDDDDDEDDDDDDDDEDDDDDDDESEEE